MRTEFSLYKFDFVQNLTPDEKRIIYNSELLIGPLNFQNKHPFDKIMFSDLMGKTYPEGDFRIELVKKAYSNLIREDIEEMIKSLRESLLYDLKYTKQPTKMQKKVMLSIALLNDMLNTKLPYKKFGESYKPFRNFDILEKKRHSVTDTNEYFLVDRDRYNRYKFYKGGYGDHDMLIQAWRQFIIDRYGDYCINNYEITIVGNVLRQDDNFEKFYNDCKNDIVFSLFGVENEDHSGGHANAVIIDKINKIIYRIDPHGGFENVSIQERFNNLIKNYDFLKDFQIKSGLEICPANLKAGLQVIEEDQESMYKIDINSGYCMAWSFMILEEAIAYNITDIPKIIANINQKANTYKSKYDGFVGLSALVRDYSNSLIQMHIDKYGDIGNLIFTIFNHFMINLTFGTFTIYGDDNKINKEKIEDLHSILYREIITVSDIITNFFASSSVLYRRNLNDIRNFFKAISSGDLNNCLDEISENTRNFIKDEDRYRFGEIESYEKIFKDFITRIKSESISTDESIIEELEELYEQFFNR